MATYAQHFSTRQTPQSQPIPGSNQVQNEAGGYSFPVSDWDRLDRFLILGAEGGTYYASERKLTVENAKAVMRCLTADGVRTVARIELPPLSSLSQPQIIGRSPESSIRT